MARDLRTKARRWLAALFVAALALAQVHGTAHALHGGRASGPHHSCPSHAKAADAALITPDQHRKAPPALPSKQLCCHAICVMAAVQLASPHMPVPIGLTVSVTRPSDRMVADGFPDRLDRPPKAGAIG